MKKEENIIKKLWNKVTLEQWYKTIRIIIICMAFMVLSEGLFEIPAVADFFGPDLILGKSGWLVYLIVWLVMFAQVAIIPIPALPILTACNQIPGLIGANNSLAGLFSWQCLLFLLLVTSATVLGAITSYWIGRAFGKPAIKWIAGSEEDYEKWSAKLNSKPGKWIYAATVLFPIFPDDLISLVVGSIKLNFTFYVITNIIGKFIGLFTILLFMRLPGVEIFFGREGSGFPVALLCYSIILITCIIIQVILNTKIKRKQPKKIKLEVVKERLLTILKRKKSAYKELILDYDLNMKFKTYLNSKVKINQYYSVDKKNKKLKSRIIIECNISNYRQIIFDRSYKLTTTYEKLLQDLSKNK